MPYYPGMFGSIRIIPHLTPKQLKAKMDKKAKRESEKYRLIVK